MRIPVNFRNNNTYSTKPKIVLAADVGATKTNIAMFRFLGETYTVLKENTYHTREFADLIELTSEFLGQNDLPDTMSFAVAGPVQHDSVNITNLSWSIDCRQLSTHYHNIPITMINDLEATAYGLAMLEEKDTLLIYEPKVNTAGNIALLAPGTGLGEAGLYWDGTTYHPFASEGGHCDFAPRTSFDIRLLIQLQKKFTHVSWERVVSGPGIVSIFEFLRENDREVPDWLQNKLEEDDKARVISENVEKASICKETMNTFFRYLATEAANVALKFKSTGGLYIAGGILPKVLSSLAVDLFITAFQDSGRMKPLLQSTPVRIITNDKIPLIGAACAGAFQM